MKEVNQTLIEDQFEFLVTDKELEINFLKEKMNEALQSDDFEFLKYLRNKLIVLEK